MMGFCSVKLLVGAIMVMNTLLHGANPQRIPAGERRVKEVFLTGSEFEASMMEHLLNSTSLVAATDEVSALLSSSNLTYTLASPDEPFEFVDRKYFWSREKFADFADGNNSTIFAFTCFYNASEDEGFLSQIYYPDGSPISEVVFGCENNKECCGMKCCGDDVLINIIIVGAISAALLLLLLCNIIIGFKRRRDKARRETSKKYQTETTNTNEINDVISPDQISIENKLTVSGHTDLNTIDIVPFEKHGKRI